MSDLHRDLVVFDGLIVSRWSRSVFEDMRRGGLTAANCTCCVWEGFQATMDNIAAWKRWFRDHGDLIQPVRTTADIAAAKRAGKTGIVLGFQNVSAFEDRVEYVELFKELGVGIAQMAYNTQNLIGTGCYESHDGGLSDFGHDVVAEMNRVGMMCDLSHVGPKTSDDVIAASTRPVCYSHCLPAGLKAHPRNKSDAQLRAIAAHGGFIGVPEARLTRKEFRQFWPIPPGLRSRPVPAISGGCPRTSPRPSPTSKPAGPRSARRASGKGRWRNAGLASRRRSTRSWWPSGRLPGAMPSDAGQPCWQSSPWSWRRTPSRPSGTHSGLPGT